VVALRAVRGRRLGVVVATLVAIAAVSAWALLHGGETASRASSASHSSDTPAPTPSPTTKDMSTKVPAAAPKLDAQQKQASTEASASLVRFLKDSAVALARKDGKAELGSLAAGPALGEIQALAAQYKYEDITVSGSPKVLGSRVVSADVGAKPAKVTLALCLDNRSVTPRDAKGHSLVKNRSPAEQVVLNLYEVQRVQNDWLVVNHSFPADSSCKRIGISS
jgi:hypothetical protein